MVRQLRVDMHKDGDEVQRGGRVLQQAAKQRHHEQAHEHVHQQVDLAQLGLVAQLRLGRPHGVVQDDMLLGTQHIH